MYFLGILPESVAYLTLRHILPIAQATIHVMLFKKIIRHLPIILQLMNGELKFFSILNAALEAQLRTRLALKLTS